MMTADEVAGKVYKQWGAGIPTLKEALRNLPSTFCPQDALGIMEAEIDRINGKMGEIGLKLLEEVKRSEQDFMLVDCAYKHRENS